MEYVEINIQGAKSNADTQTLPCSISILMNREHFTVKIDKDGDVLVTTHILNYAPTSLVDLLQSVFRTLVRTDSHGQKRVLMAPVFVANAWAEHGYHSVPYQGIRKMSEQTPPRCHYMFRRFRSSVV